ncbi:MAG: tetratricopeptide repeat protein [Saprospiraceae bacterium]|nr:tetratricopeptide repeat protein [Saprospiraceae bacterium]
MFIGLLVIFSFLDRHTEHVDHSISDLLAVGEALEWSNPDSALSLYRTAYLKALAEDSTLQQGLAMYYTSLVHMDQGRFDSATLYVDQSLAIFSTIENREYLCKGYNAKANNLQFANNFKESIVAYQEALDLAEELGDALKQARILSNQSSVFNMAGRIESSQQCLKKAEVLAKSFGETSILGDIYINLANNYQSINSFEKAITYTRQAAGIYHAVSDLRYEALALTNLAGLLHEQKPMDLDESLECLERSRAILDSVRAPSIEVNYWKHLAYFHYKKKAFKKAESAAERCLEFLKEFADLRSESTIKEIMYSIHKSEGNYMDALHFHEQYFGIRDSLIYQDSRDQLQELEAKYQSTKKDSQISKQQLIVSQRTAQRNLLMLGLLSALLLISFLVDRYRKNRRLALEKVQNLEKQQKLLVMNSMLDGQEEERKRVAQDLHDGLGGLLSSARMQIKSVQREIDKLDDLKLIDRTEELIDHACKEVRRIAHNMMPGALMDLGFLDAVEDLVNDIKLRDNIDISVEIPSQPVELPDSTSVNLYRVIQEIFQNIQKHAQASRVHLSIDFVGNELMVHLADNGVGFNPEHLENSGLGLKGMQARIDYLGGTIHREATVGQGCTYMISVPI